MEETSNVETKKKVPLRTLSRREQLRLWKERRNKTKKRVVVMNRRNKENRENRVRVGIGKNKKKKKKRRDTLFPAPSKCGSRITLAREFAKTVRPADTSDSVSHTAVGKQKREKKAVTSKKEEKEAREDTCADDFVVVPHACVEKETIQNCDAVTAVETSDTKPARKSDIIRIDDDCVAPIPTSEASRHEVSDDERKRRRRTKRQERKKKIRSKMKSMRKVIESLRKKLQLVLCENDVVTQERDQEQSKRLRAEKEHETVVNAMKMKERAYQKETSEKIDMLKHQLITGLQTSVAKVNALKAELATQKSTVALLQKELSEARRGSS